MKKARRIVSASVGLVLVGTTVSACAEQSPFSVVKDFLVAWQVKNYDAAAKNTTGDRQKVAAALRGVSQQLDAASLHLSLKGTVCDGNSVTGSGVKQEGRIDREGDTAQARFQVRIDLGENGSLWSYAGLLPLKRIDGRWKVVWSPAVIHPALGEGDRLAVVTKYPDRKMILDKNGRALLKNVKIQQVGVVPAQVKDLDGTVKALNDLTKQDADRLKGRILSAPPLNFLQLATVRAADVAKIADLRSKAPDLQYHLVNEPVEPLQAKELIGSLAPATSDLLSKVGAPYQPGDTVGASGLELLFQRRLAGVPTVKVVVVDSAGRLKGKPLAENPGNECKATGDAASGATTTTDEDPDARDSKTVTTTIDPQYQARAERTLKQLDMPGSIVTILGKTGSVLAAANNLTGDKNTAFEGEFPPGMVFSPIVATGLLSSDRSVTAQVPCLPSTTVGGQTFVSTAAQKSSLGLNMIRGCTSYFAQLGSTLPATDFAAAMKKFGLDLQWDMSQVPHFQATGITPVTDVDRANAAIGQGGVKVSPLTMALAASAIQNGTWHEPGMILSPDPAATVNARYLGVPVINSLGAIMKKGAQFNFPSNRKAYDGALTATAKDDKGNPISWFIGYKGDYTVAIAIQGRVADMAKVALGLLKNAQVPTADAPISTQVN
jgi:hypothetical protein